MNRIRNRILRIETSALGIMKWVLFTITAAMTATVLLGVFFRYILKSPLPWSEELARYLMIWGASLGASVAFREGSHVGVTVIMDRFHGKMGVALTRVAQTVIVVFMGIVVVEGFVLITKLRGQTSTAMEIPMPWAYSAIPVGCLLILLETVIVIFFKNHHDLTRDDEQ